MINFRFHIISLVAVFLALALGIFLGSAVGEPTIVDRLRGQIDSVRRASNERAKDNAALQRENNQLQAFIDATGPFAVDGRLTGADVVVVAERGVDDKPVSATVDLLANANANPPMVVWLERRWALIQPDDIERAASLLHLPTTDPNGLRVDLFNALARRFARPPSVTSGTPDILRQLVDAKFISVDGIDKDQLATFPLQRALALVVDGPQGDIAEPAVFQQSVTAFMTRGITTVAAEIGPDSTDPGAPQRGDTIAIIRGDNRLENRVSTVDDLDLAQGRIVAVLALVLQDGADPVVDDYGYGRGASRSAPELPTQ
jgi:hypothetical protein